jgi:hypothetical protein
MSTVAKAHAAEAEEAATPCGREKDCENDRAARHPCAERERRRAQM